MTPTTTPDTSVTVHDLYASAALTGLLANTDLHPDYDRTTKAAHHWADAMMDRRPDPVGR